MSQIVPAILEETKEGFLKQLSRISKLPGIERVQVDFEDGIFVSRKILPVTEIDALNPAFHWEAHLMLKEPKDFLDYQICGFKTIIIHYEAYSLPTALKIAVAEIKKMGFKVGVAINPETDVEVLKDIEADQYLLMSVTPGNQGEKFIENSLNKIKLLRQLLPHAIIEVDGGVNETNIKAIKDAGADLIIAGSALVKAEDMNLAYEKLLKEIQ